MRTDRRRWRVLLLLWLWMVAHEVKGLQMQGTGEFQEEEMDVEGVEEEEYCDVAIEYTTDVVSNPGGGSSLPMFLGQAILVNTASEPLQAWEMKAKFQHEESITQDGLFGARFVAPEENREQVGMGNSSYAGVVHLASLPEETPAITAGGQGSFVFLARQGNTGNGALANLTLNGKTCNMLWERLNVQNQTQTELLAEREAATSGNVLVAYRAADYVFAGPYWKFWQDFNFTVVNRLHSSGPVELEDVQLSYWFEGSPGDFEPEKYSFVCRSAAIGCQYIRGTVVKGLEGESGAKFELRITFEPGAGELPVPPTGLQGEELVQFWSRNSVDGEGDVIGMGWGATVGIESSNFLFWMDEKQDYSYAAPVGSALRINPRMAAYLDGTKEFGIPPVPGGSDAVNASGPAVCKPGETGCMLSAAYCCAFSNDTEVPLVPLPEETPPPQALSPSEDDADVEEDQDSGSTFEWWWLVLAIGGSLAALGALVFGFHRYRRNIADGFSMAWDGKSPFFPPSANDDSPDPKKGAGFLGKTVESSPTSTLEHIAVSSDGSREENHARHLSLLGRGLNFLAGNAQPPERSFPSIPEISAPAQASDAPNGVEVQFLEDVKLERFVGQGAFGTVYQGWWGNKKVAVKVLSSDFASEQQRNSLHREVQILSRLDHPNIVTFYGACMFPPDFCIVEELVEGGSLHSVLHDRRKTLSYLEILQLSRDIACAMTYLQPTVIHRDLKSHNVLLTTDGRAKVCDFGIAKFKEGTYLTLNTGGIGTAAYMAPELFSCKKVTEKCDVFSFGVLLWEMIARREPWTEFTNFMQFVMMVGVQKKRLPIPDDCPKKLKSMMQRCWSDDPHKRPSFAELLRKFDLLLKDFDQASGSHVEA